MIDNVKDKKKLRILHVLTAMNRAGTETMLMNLYRTINRDVIQFDFAVSAQGECDYDEEIKKLGGKIIHYPKYKGINHLSYVKWWNKFFKEHSEYKIVHGHIGSTAAIYLSIAKKYGCFSVAHSHNTSCGKGLHKILYKFYSYPTRYIADYFFGCSEAALRARYGEKIANNKSISSVLNNGINISNYEYSEIINKEVRTELGISENVLLIGTVGRMTDQKNPFFTIRILSDLKKIVPDFCFLWAGTGELLDSIKKEIKENGLQNNVKLLGVRNDINRILQALNVFILPSKYEGLPVIGVEVQAAGVPMLCSNKVSSELNFSDCCKMLPIDSVQPWVESIIKEKNFRRISNASQSVANSGYDINKTSVELTKFYFKCANL